jgi:hypothetical protein
MQNVTYIHYKHLYQSTGFSTFYFDHCKSTGYMYTFSNDSSIMLQSGWASSVSIRDLLSCFNCVLHWISTAYSKLCL